MSKTIYYNGSILTMTRHSASAVVVENGRITGTKAAVHSETISGYDAPKPRCDEPSAPGASTGRTRLVDLKGACLMPAFIDPHSHFSGCATSLLQVPLDEAVSFEEISAAVRSYIQENGIPAGAWVVAKNYDHNNLAEHRHPTAALLDAAAPENPVVIMHQSGHMGVFNSAALRLLSVNGQTQAPEGGLIAKENGEPTGYMEENAFIKYQQLVPMASMEDLLSAYQTAQEKYASYGITTVQEGMFVDRLIPLYRLLLEKKMLYLDVVGYADAKNAGALLSAFPEHRRVYKEHFKMGGLKIFLDGSPQGRTAWMRAPYADSPDYCGYNTLTDGQVTGFARLAARENMQLIAHCNGDAAAAQFIRACAAAEAEGQPLAQNRPVLIHGQLLGTDQLKELKKLGIMPSFFAAHVYYWGDAHIRNFGMKRASHITPAAAALAEGVPFTFHQDSPVLKPDMLETVWCSVNRLTKGGVRLDAEAIPVEEALKAVTINAAYQYFEENEKGSIEADKKADFVILDKNPLTVEPMELKNIKVLQTIKDGEIIYEG